ncbi:MAG: hypothetical protein LIP08_01330 [Bacteroides sp.]|nr:hypothetical protein [Bacteroides sp.]
MKGNSLRSQVTTGRFTLPVAILLSTACWVVAGVLLPELSATRSPGETADRLLPFVLPNPLGWAVSFLLYLFTGYLLIALNNTFGLIRIRASVQSALFLLLIGICPGLHLFYTGSILPVSLLLSLYFLFRSYQNHKASGNLFYSFCFLGISTLLLPILIWFIPLWLLGAYNLQCFTLKSFFASLTGWFFPYWLLLGHAYFYGEMELFYWPFRQWITFYPVRQILEISLPQWSILGYLLIIYIVSTCHTFVKGYQDKIRTRSYLHFLMLVILCLYLLILLQPICLPELLPVLMALISILAAHFFVLSDNRGSNIFFIASVIGVCILFGYNLWVNL